ncbi:MAG: rRNA maturation RNase YbeY [Phaeodactylibacter sp.]|nr:rRNA maturation RNase YbeY [Phaeodactylibacter sp.]
MIPENFLPEDSSTEGFSLVEFYYEEIDFQLKEPQNLVDWILAVIKQEDRRLVHLNFIFCSDSYLHKINVEYLDHDTLTDVITFPYLDPPDVEGDIFISVDRVRENAQQLKLGFEEELNRVMIHGVLHLCGYGDKSAAEKEQMNSKENEALAQLNT